MSLLARIGGVLLCGATIAAAARASEFAGYGPLPVRNFQPVQQIFLSLPFERAQTLRPGEFELHVESAESNEIATNQEDVEALLKFETNRTVLGGSLSVRPGLDIGLDIPFMSRFGGFMDPFVDSVEDLFATSNPERRMFPNNSFGGFHVQRGGVVLFDGKRQDLELGDIWASAKVEVWQAPGWPLIALRGAIKGPTGRAGGVFGSGKPDFGVGVAAEHQALSWLMIYGNFNVVYPVGRITPARLTLNPMLAESVGAEAYLGRHVSLVLQQHTHTSPIHGTGTRLLDGTAVEMAAGLNWAPGPWLFQLGVIDNISPVATSADFTMMLRLGYRR